MATDADVKAEVDWSRNRRRSLRNKLIALMLVVIILETAQIARSVITATTPTVTSDSDVTLRGVSLWDVLRGYPYGAKRQVKTTEDITITAGTTTTVATVTGAGVVTEIWWGGAWGQDLGGGSGTYMWNLTVIADVDGVVNAVKARSENYAMNNASSADVSTIDRGQYNGEMYRFGRSWIYYNYFPLPFSTSITFKLQNTGAAGQDATSVSFRAEYIIDNTAFVWKSLGSPRVLDNLPVTNGVANAAWYTLLNTGNVGKGSLAAIWVDWRSGAACGNPQTGHFEAYVDGEGTPSYYTTDHESLFDRGFNFGFKAADDTTGITTLGNTNCDYSGYRWFYNGPIAFQTSLMLRMQNGGETAVPAATVASTVFYYVNPNAA